MTKQIYKINHKLNCSGKCLIHLLTCKKFLLKKANDHVNEIPTISVCYAYVNCRLRVKFHDAKQEDIFFLTFDELRDIVDSEI